MFLPQYKLLTVIINIYLLALLFFMQYFSFLPPFDPLRGWKMPGKDKTRKNNHNSEILVPAGTLIAHH
jgi:hypothetical protein